VLVTGSGGFIGQRVGALLEEHGATVLGCEPPNGDVLYAASLPDADYCIHLAAHKYATTAEDTPATVADLNIRGTANVIDRYGPNVVLASTCKAADPMTVYGASKLIAERIVLNAGAKVVRFVNVCGSVGSVAEIWADTPADEPLKVTSCYRMWMTEAEAVRLLIAALDWPTGRYALDVPDPEAVWETMKRLHPNRTYDFMPPRRGDRVRERLVAEYETTVPHVSGVVAIKHPADL
jgi:FlaA1/EpsC-like NDP-sugar epimerase